MDEGDGLHKADDALVNLLAMFVGAVFGVFGYVAGGVAVILGLWSAEKSVECKRHLYAAIALSCCLAVPAMITSNLFFLFILFVLLLLKKSYFCRERREQ